MKFSFFNLLAVCLTTLGWFTSAQTALGASAVTTNHQSTSRAAVPQLLTPTQQGAIANFLLGFAYVGLPVGFCLSIFLHDRYYAYRSAILKQQVEILERLWEQSPRY
jgi:uncharacterized membrane protein